MKIKCEFCGAMINDTEATCPNCGAANHNVKRVVDRTPQTIEELEKWYEARKLPPYETTRFFIGQDYKGAKAFGIYKDGTETVVYKNKADGTRAERYRGTDEAYAVNELYLKLKSEILNQKAHNQTKSGNAPVPQNKVPTAPGKPVVFDDTPPVNKPKEKQPWEYIQRTDNWLKKAIFWFLVVCGLGMVLLFKYRFLLVLVLFALLFAATYGLSKLIVKSWCKRTGYEIKDFIQAHPKLSKWLYFDSLDFMDFSRTTIILMFLTIIISGSRFANYTTAHYYWNPKGDNYYVNYHDDWYEYDYYEDDYEYIPSNQIPDAILTNPTDYEFDWYMEDWDSSITSFKDSSTYENSYPSDVKGWDWGDDDDDSWLWDNDNDFDWGGGDSWDDGNTNWDSDW